jgi:hypothetical protein
MSEVTLYPLPSKEGTTEKGFKDLYLTAKAGI